MRGQRVAGSELPLHPGQPRGAPAADGIAMTLRIAVAASGTMPSVTKSAVNEVLPSSVLELVLVECDGGAHLPSAP